MMRGQSELRTRLLQVVTIVLIFALIAFAVSHGPLDKISADLYFPSVSLLAQPVRLDSRIRVLRDNKPPHLEPYSPAAPDRAPPA